MRHLDKNALQKLSSELAALCSEMLQLETAFLHEPLAIHEAHRPSARNLAHYLALRRHDIRQLQMQLARLGLSSLGRTEGHVFDAVRTVEEILTLLQGKNSESPALREPVVAIGEGAELLDKNTEVLLGPLPEGRKVRIMVTMATDAATDYALVRDLVESGMDCMRINCAHDSPPVWLAMIENLKRARAETGRACRILMDLPGPKLRTGTMEPGPAVLKCRPKRDLYGRVISPARIWLTSDVKARPAPNAATVTLPLPTPFLETLRSGDILRLRDSRKAHRLLRVTHRDDSGCWAEARQTIYFIAGLELHLLRRDAQEESKSNEVARVRIGELPALPQFIILKEGDTLLLTRANVPGRPARAASSAAPPEPARISVSVPQILDHAKPGEPVWIDDGKIGAVIRTVNANGLSVEITQARPEGEKLGPEKGINLPETKIDIPALTEEDLAALPFIVGHADIVGLSFVRAERDVRDLLDRLERLGGQRLGLILKIETRKGFENLPKLVLAAMRTRSLGIMIARGDLMVECGYQRLAEIQEEILWICEAAHVPVIWATQVLENLGKKGIPSRSEITDAAMGERAECVMLNKGPYTVMAVRVLADILKRMQAHQEKKRSLLRQLALAASVSDDK